MTTNRQLAAIMFTDIVGYTSFMGRDEQKAFKLLSKNREIQKPIIEQFNGLWIKEIGDGVMASFNTVSDAVYAALKIMESCNVIKDFQLRVGIHQGEVVMEGNDMFGDAVNIASRIQAIAEPGCIYISESVQSNISNKPDINTRFVKEEKLKNVKELIKIYEAVTMTDYHRSIFDNSSWTQRAKSIAVLPFVNMSNDAEQEYFCDGITEEIINALCHIKKLKVISRTSVFEFKNKNEDIRKIGDKLDVGFILEGSVRKAGNRLRITAQLIKVKDGSHLWSEKYDRELKDIFEIQDEISLAIVEKMKIEMFDKEQENLLNNYTSNVEAYNLYLLGLYEWYKRNEESINRSIDYFEKALEVDPNYTLAYCGIANAYSALTDWGVILPKDALPIARNALEKAIKIDPGLAEIYVSYIYLNICDWDMMNSERNFYKAISINPKIAVAYHLFGLKQACLGKFDDALVKNRFAREIDPLSLIFNFAYGLILYFSGQLEKALEQWRKTKLINNNFMPAILWSTYCYLLLDKPKEAVREFQKILTQYPDSSDLLHQVKNAYEASGIKGFLHWLIEDGLSYYKRRHNLYYHKAICHAFLNDADNAMACLDEGFKQRSARMIMIKFEPGLDNIKLDPRFKVVLDKINLW